MTIGSHQRTIGVSQTHLTPPSILNALGHFDLDPCAAIGQPWRTATRHLTEAEDGLSQTWQGRVWLNPPFHRYQIGRWIDRLVSHGDGILLVHARTEAGWFEPIWRSASAILFLADRIKFFDINGRPQRANSGAPVVLAAFGGGNADVLKGSGIAGFVATQWIEQRSAEVVK